MEKILAVLVFFPFIAGLLAYGAGNAGRKRHVLGVSLVTVEALLTALLSWNALLDQTEVAVKFYLPAFCGFGLHLELDGFRLIYACVTAFMWTMTILLSGEYLQRHEHVGRFYLFMFWTLGATMGVFLSGDLYTTFLFFEIMSFTSYVWVVQEEDKAALQAGSTYLAVAVTGGLVMLMGIFLLYHSLGTVMIDELYEAGTACANKKMLYAAGACMLFGFGAKAGVFPLHLWLPKAHPVAPAPASALLSGVLTKTGIYGILILSCRLFLHDTAWGKLILTLGVITMLGGAFLAVFSIDLKRTLACSSMSQIGFILLGIGMQCLLGEENAPAAYGTLLHMVNHSLIKLVLFMAAGVIFMNTHALDLNQIRGYGRKKPLLAGIFLIGALAIGGIPMFGGYVSKTLLHEAILEYDSSVMAAVEWLFLLSGGLTIAYMTKLFAAIFIEKNEDRQLQAKYDGETEKSSRHYMNGNTAFALVSSALVLLVWGLFPHSIMDRVAKLGQSFMRLDESAYRISYFSPENLKGALISILIGAAVYLLFVRKVLMRKSKEYVNLWPRWLDLENLLYRPLLLNILPTLLGVLCRILDSFADGVVVLLRKTIYHDSPLPHERWEGNAFTAAAGRILNGFEALGNHTWHRSHPRQVDYVHLLAEKNEVFKENNRIIERSLSFGLLLFCIGLSLTLIYIIWW